MSKRQTGEVLTLWRRLQRLEWQSYQESARGVFSVAGHKVAPKVGRIVAEQVGSGLCLDVGCGCLSRPSYMVEPVRFIGIDPFFGDKRRAFPFSQAVGEALPFRDGAFDAVLFASSLDHCFDPLFALREARRVLRKDGKLLVWFSRRWGLAYEQWRKGQGARLYNPHHQWAWNEKTMGKLVKKAGFELVRMYRPEYKKNRVLVGRKP